MKKILIIEDDQFLVDAYKTKLSHIENIKVTTARDGKEALDSINTDKPDVIILDLLTPNLDGFGFLEGLRVQNIKIPVLVASNLGSEEDIKKAMDLGAQGYFIKSNSSIQDIINKIMDMAGK